jgi:hypothetical protein
MGVGITGAITVTVPNLSRSYFTYIGVGISGAITVTVPGSILLLVLVSLCDFVTGGFVVT